MSSYWILLRPDGQPVRRIGPLRTLAEARRYVGRGLVDNGWMHGNPAAQFAHTLTTRIGARRPDGVPATYQITVEKKEGDR